MNVSRPLNIRGPEARGGFTLVEMLFALVLGLVITASALSFAINVFRNVEGDKEREEIYRNSRFIGMSLGRDIQYAGVGIESEIQFGTISTLADTLVILYVPWTPTLAHAHEIVTPLGSSNPLPAGGTCGSYCIRLQYDAGGGFNLAPGDLARLQVNTERHLIVVESVVDNGTNFDLTFRPDTMLLGFDAAFQGGLLLDNTTTFIQEMGAVVYFEQDSVLFRADRFDSLGVLQSAPIAYGVHTWDARMLFMDGDTAVAANPDDADVTNDFDDILGVRVTTTLGTNRPMRVSGGNVFDRAYEWVLTPRNLMYERNR